MDTCRKCGGELPAAGRRGPRATYCSVKCRRAAELEIRRVNDRIDGLENRVSECRIAASSVGVLKGYPIDDPIAIEKEIEVQRQRLLDLLSEEDEATAPAP